MKTKIILPALLLAVWAQAQVTFTQESIATTGQYTICAVDMNGDYLDDIVSVSSTNIQIFYQNEDGSFTEDNVGISAVTHLPSWSLAAGDVNNDGRNDLLLGSGSGASFLIQNNDGTAFTEITSPQYIFSQRTNFVDINNDGWLDGFVCHDIGPNVYFINDGVGGFETMQGGLGDFPQGGHYGSVWVDFNNDGLIDMFIAKCSGGGQGAGAKYNELHINNGDGTYTEIGYEAGLRDPLQTWSSAWGDFNNDGWMDVLVGANSFSDGGHKLMLNNGDGTFSDVTAGTVFENFNGTSREHVAYDFDNDGFLDIVGNSGQIFYGNGDMTFTQGSVPFSGAAIADLNNDGFMDAMLNSTIYYNNGNANNWVKIYTQGVESNRNGIGARVEVYTTSGKQIREVRSGEGFRYMSSLNVHFGLGADTEIERIVVRWPSGTVDEIENPQINEALLIVEGSSTTSLTDFNWTTLLLYPNPATDAFVIDSPMAVEGAEVAVFDNTGKLVLENTLDQTRQTDVSSLKAGIYLVKITLNGQVLERKLAKK